MSMPEAKLAQESETRGPPRRAAWPGELPDKELLDRFCRLHDEAAFEALVRRHGSMVLGVCRRILRHAQDAEDAFQATFLVLVRRAGSVRRPESLANWLYGVAVRTARNAQLRAARRQRREREAVSMSAASPDWETDRQDLQALLDEELRHLPAKYRAPLVLCYLEGQTNEQAARQLGWPPGSMSARLARGRELLRDRLARHRADASTCCLPALLAAQQGALLPAALVHSTVRAAMDLSAGEAIAEGARALVEAALRAESAARRRRLYGLLLILLALVLGTSAVLGAILAGAPPDADPCLTGH